MKFDTKFEEDNTLTRSGVKFNLLIIVQIIPFISLFSSSNNRCINSRNSTVSAIINRRSSCLKTTSKSLSVSKMLGISVFSQIGSFASILAVFSFSASLKSTKEADLLVLACLRSILTKTLSSKSLEFLNGSNNNKFNA